MRVAAPAVAVMLALFAGRARAGELAALAPPSGDDARKAVAIGPSGEVYEPDGKGAWVRRQRITTADKLAVAGRAGGAIVAGGDGVVYRLAANGWTALRLAQTGKAVLSSGAAVAAVGRQLYALDKSNGGELVKLALAPATVLAIGAGKQLAIATERGLFRVAGTKLTKIPGAPRRVDALVGDAWALLDHGALELATKKVTRWPAGLSISVAVTGPTNSLVAVGTSRGKLELVTLRAGKLEREPIAVSPAAKAVGVAVDKMGRAVVALRDGRLVVRQAVAGGAAAPGNWTVSTVSESLPPAHPGSPPAKGP